MSSHCSLTIQSSFRQPIMTDLRSILKGDQTESCTGSKVICIHVNTWNRSLLVFDWHLLQLWGSENQDQTSWKRSMSTSLRKVPISICLVTSLGPTVKFSIGRQNFAAILSSQGEGAFLQMARYSCITGEAQLSGSDELNRQLFVIWIFGATS